MLVAETILSLQGHLRDYPVRYSQGRTQGSAFNSKPLKVQLLRASLLRTHKSPHFNSIYLFCAVQLFVGIVESKVLPFRFVSSLDRGNSHNILWKLHQFNSQSLKRKKKKVYGFMPDSLTSFLSTRLFRQLSSFIPGKGLEPNSAWGKPLTQT